MDILQFARRGSGLCRASTLLALGLVARSDGSAEKIPARRHEIEGSHVGRH